MKMRLNGLRMAWLWGGVFLALLLAQSAVYARQAAASAIQRLEEPRGLAAGEMVEREMAAGETHAYRITLAEGQYLRVVVEQRSVDLTAKLFAPVGQPLIESNNPRGTAQPEIISFVTEMAGDYRLEVRAVAPSGKGQYLVCIKELRAATPADHPRVKADNLFAEAERLGARAEQQSQQLALAKYLEALPLWQSLKDRAMEARTLVNIGVVEQNLSDNKTAIGYFEQALPILREQGNRRGEAQTLNNIGWVYTFLGETQKALDYYLEALPIRREAGDRRGEAQTLTNLGAAYDWLGEPSKALDHFNQALEMARSMKDRGLEAYTLGNLSALLKRLDEPQKAFEHLNAAIAIWRETGNRYGEADALNVLGMIYSDLGDFEKALASFTQSLKLGQMTGNRHGEAQVLNNIGTIYHAQTEYQQALDYYNRSLALRQAIGDRAGEAATLANMGLTYLYLSQTDEALDYLNRALPLYKAGRNLRGEAVALDNIGSAYIHLGEREKALKHFAEALRLSRAAGLRQIEASVLGGIARAHRGQSNFIEARTHIEAALAIIESLRAKVTAENLRASYFANKQDFYNFYITLLIDMHRRWPAEPYDAVALEASERARARSLLDSLAASRADIRAGIAPPLLARERELRQRLNGREAYRIRLLGGKPSAEQVANVERQITELQAEYQTLQAQIRERNPHYATLIQPATVGPKEIQQQLLDDDTLLLEYALSRERSFLWAITSKTFASFELPGRAKIEQAARQTYELLTVSHRRQHKREAERAAAELSRMLLGPVADQLGKKRLLIVADGILQYVPFGGLPAPEAQGQTAASYIPLIVNHEVVNLPSASVLAGLRREVAARKRADKLIAIFADPVLQNDDERIKQAASGKPADPLPVAERATADDLPEAAREVGLTGFERLPFTGQEAAAILSLAGEKNSLQALGFKASVASATSPELAGYRIVHFATHGLINSLHPELSGLVLSLVDEQGRPQNGFLRTQDIYNLKLGADLVVLSSCRTALGKLVRGEGLVGLVRGFMYAGAPRVVASLWDVKDDATAELMKRFYGKMLKEAMRPAAALRAAQMEMLSEPRWRAPYYWAGFALQGEWQ